MTMFELMAAALFAATAAMYFLRLRHESPSFLPYLLISLASAAGCWLDEQGASAAAVAMLVTGAFLLLHIVSLPYSERRRGAPRR